MKSSYSHYLFFKYLLLICSCILAIAAIIKGAELSGSDAWTKGIKPVIILLTLSGLALIAFLLLKDRFAVLELHHDKITIYQGKNKKQIEWNDVQTLRMLQFIRPPVYSLKLKKDEESILFISDSFYGHLGGLVKDLSPLSALIEKKKRELGI